MNRALVLNAAGAWSAYQVGALQYLVAERDLRFDLVAGTGLGAVNAALVACGGWPALAGFWDGLGWCRLVAPNWRTPWREGPCTLAPLRRFLDPRLSEDRLAARGIRLMVSTLDLQSGAERVWTYPGGAIPLLDAVLAAASTPGLMPPLRVAGHQLVSASFANNLLLPRLLDLPIAEIVVVAAIMRRGGHPRPWYTTVRPALERDLAMNQANDVWQGLAAATDRSQAAAAGRRVAATVSDRVAGRVADPGLRAQLRARLATVYGLAGAAPEAAPRVRSITPSADLSYSAWRFPRAGLAAARALGYRDARVAGTGEGAA